MQFFIWCLVVLFLCIERVVFIITELCGGAFFFFQFDLYTYSWVTYLGILALAGRRKIFGGKYWTLWLLLVVLPFPGFLLRSCCLTILSTTGCKWCPPLGNTWRTRCRATSICFNLLQYSQGTTVQGISCLAMHFNLWVWDESACYFIYLFTAVRLLKYLYTCACFNYYSFQHTNVQTLWEQNFYMQSVQMLDLNSLNLPGD